MTCPTPATSNTSELHRRRSSSNVWRCWQCTGSRSGRQPVYDVIDRRYGEEEAVCTVEQAAMAGNQMTGVLNPDLTLDQRFGEIPGLSGDASEPTDQQTLPGADWKPE